MDILLVEDYLDLQRAIAESLQRLNHVVIPLSTAEEVDAALAERHLDLAVIDLNLPGEDGLSLIRRLRHTRPELGIIVMSARDTTLDRISGYQSGADLYLTKPVVHEELFAAVQALSRRLQRRTERAGVRDASTPALDRNTLEIRGPLGISRLTTTEFSLLASLAQAKDRTLETEQIYQILGRNAGKKSALEALVYRVRRKMAQAGAGEHCIRAHRLKGYQLLCPMRID